MEIMNPFRLVQSTGKNCNEVILKTILTAKEIFNYLFQFYYLLS